MNTLYLFCNCYIAQAGVVYLFISVAVVTIFTGKMVKTSIKKRVNLEMEDFQDHITSIALECVNSGTACDCILKSGSSELYVHKLVLSFSSDFLAEVLKSTSESMVYLTIPDVKTDILEWLIALMYTGEIGVPVDRRVEFIEACRLLRLKAVDDMVDDLFEANETIFEDERMLSEEEDIEFVAEELEIAGESSREIPKSKSLKQRVIVDDSMKVSLTDKLDSLIRKSYGVWTKDKNMDLVDKDHKIRIVVVGDKLIKGLFDCCICGTEISVVYTTDKKGRFKQWVNSNMRRHLFRIHKFFRDNVTVEIQT